MARKAASAVVDSLHTAPTADLIREIKRRSLGIMLVCVKAEERGDQWHYALKGSPLLLGALGAALSLKTNEHLAELRPGAESIEVE